MEPQELSPALLQPQVTVVATLGKLLDTLPRREEETLLQSSKRLYGDLEEFTEKLWITLHCIDDTWKHPIVTDDDDGGVTSLSQALAAYRRTPLTTWDRVAMAASEWQRLMNVLVDSCAQLARKAAELRDTWSKVATEAATTWARELQEKGAHYGTALEHKMELDQALGMEEGAEVVAGPESPVRREAMVAASEAAMATMERQWLEVALGLLQCLVAACDEATAFPWELQRLLRDTEIALKGTKKQSPDVPDALVAKVAQAERLWEANTCLAKEHLLRMIDDFFDYYSKGGHSRPSACGMAVWCQIAIEDIPRFLQPPEHPQRVPMVSPVSTELKELSPALLQPQVTVVATLGELLDTLHPREEGMLLESSECLYWDLKEFTKDLWITLHCINDTWRRHIVTDDDGDPITSLSQALAAYRRTPRTTQVRVAMAARKWQRSVSELVNWCAQLARKVTKFRDAWSKVATDALTTRARELQEKGAHYGTALEHKMELDQALGGEEGAEVVAGHGAQVRREAMVAASEATSATMERQRLEAAVGLLHCLVAACDKATAFPWELQRLLRDTEIALKGTKKQSPDVPDALVAKVAQAERLWEANMRLAKEHLLGIIDDFLDYYSKDCRSRPSAREVAKRCQRAIEDIPNLLQGW